MLLVLVNGAFFVSARPQIRDFGVPRPAWLQRAHDEAFDWIFSRTAAALREHEDVVRTFVASIRGLFPPEETAIITELGNPRPYPWLRHAMFYLPEYPIYELRVGDAPPGVLRAPARAAMRPEADVEVTLPPSVKRLVWFVDHWSPSPSGPRVWTRSRSRTGASSTCCRSAARRSSTRATPWCARLRPARRRSSRADRER